MTHRQPAAALRDVSFRYPLSARPALTGVTLEVPGSTHLALLGPNGSGKTTLLRCMLGRLKPQRGEIRLLGRRIGEWKPAGLARVVGVVPQEEHLVFPSTVREAVALGRYPHLGPWRLESDRDRSAVDRALQRCDVWDLRARRLDMLSGGERQRVRIARALAQEPRMLVLDEPTIHLDVRHEMEIFELVRSLVTEAGLTVMTVTHNLSLAARYADNVALLKEGVPVAEGPPRNVLSQALLEDVFGWPVGVERDSQGELVLVPRSVVAKASSPVTAPFWQRS